MAGNTSQEYGFPDPWWERGNIPKDIESIYAGLASPPNSHAHHVALSDLTGILKYAMGRALADDPSCGALLGELLAVLWKNRLNLQANWYFKEAFSQLHSARPATRKRSALRRLIEKIIADVQSSYAYFFVTNDLPPVLKNIDLAQLRSLPEFGPSKEAIDAWTEVIVYPRLQQMETTLRDDPEIGNLKKAFQSGKFHVSSLRPLIRETVARIAEVPRGHYFDISDPCNPRLIYC